MLGKVTTQLEWAGEQRAKCVMEWMDDWSGLDTPETVTTARAPVVLTILTTILTTVLTIILTTSMTTTCGANNLES